MYEQPSMPRPPYIRVGAEGAISPQCSIFASSTLREPQNDKRSKVSLPANASSSTQTPQGQPCSTGVGNNPLTITKLSQRAVSRTSGFAVPAASLTRRAGWATFYACPLATHFEHISFPHFPSTQKIAARSLRNRNETRRCLPYPALRVCLKRNNSQVRADFASVQGRNPKA